MATWACWVGMAFPILGGGVVEDHTVVWLDQEQGLPSGGASVMVQARDGYLWFGTFGGIARFDGVGFKVFTPADTPELPSAGVANAYCDRSGRLWFSTYGGMVSLEGGRWRRHDATEGWTCDYARTFAEGKDGTLYITGFDGKVLRRVHGRFEEMPPVPDDRLGGFGHCDAEGRFWVAKDDFIGFWDGAAWSPVTVPLENGAVEEGDDGHVDGIGAGPAKDGQLWVLKHRLLLKVGATGVVRRVVLDQPVRKFWSLHEDREGNLWVASRDHGLYHVRLTSDSGSPRTGRGRVTIILNAGGRDFRSVPFVSEDDEGNLWTGTASEGVARWRSRLFGVVGRDEGLSHANLRSVAVDSKGRLWAAAYSGGIFLRDVTPGGGASFRPLDPWMTAEVESVLADRSGRVWAVRLGAGGPVTRLDEEPIRVAYSGAGSVMARWALHEDARGVLWVGGPGETVSHDKGRWERHSPRGIRAFADGADEPALWAGGTDGLYRLQDGEFAEVRDAEGSPFPMVTCLHPAPDGGLWVGTDGRGLVLLRRDGSTARLEARHGVTMNPITLLYSDGKGLLWMGGEQGIACMKESQAVDVASGQASRLHVRWFGTEDGLPGNCNMLHARTPQVARTSDGRLWFPTSRGLVHVDPASVPGQSRPPRVLSGSVVHVDDDGVAREVPWGFGEHLVFGPGTRSIRFGFAALSYAAPHRVVARFRLHRHGAMVAERVGPDRWATWDLLPPGEYTLAVAAANEAGVWSPGADAVHFTVRPHYWQTTGFRVAIGLGVLGGVVALAAYRVRHAKLAWRLSLAERDRLAAVERAGNAEALRRSEGLRQEAEAEAVWRRRREAVVRDVHDGIGGLASNLKMTVNLALRARDEKARSALLQTMDSLVGETLMEVHGLMDTLEAEVGTCGEMADEFRRHGNLMLGPHDVALFVRASRPEARLPMDPRFFPSVFRIYKEAIANIVKHAGATRVEVHLEASPDGLHMTVADDGVGLPAGGRRGRGLANMHRRAAELGGRLATENIGGLRLTLDVPWPGSVLAPPSSDASKHPTEEVGA